MSQIFEDFVAVSRYCRWVPELNRRETWTEAVDRYFDYLLSRIPKDLPKQALVDLESARVAMKNRTLFGSMRTLMTAGPALDGDDVAAYNCCYIAVNKIRDFSNIMYTLMCGTGVGFSVEKEEVDNLPVLPDQIIKIEEKIVVEDSRLGWAEAYYCFIDNLFRGLHCTVDTSKIRPAGARLKTFGGRASGPEPFIRLIKFTANIFYTRLGKKLRPIDVHDLVCQIAEIVICGGVRRSALISLSDLNDYEMAHAKSGPWWEKNGYRSLANNSAVYTSKPDMGTFLTEWQALYNSRSGERGICNRQAMIEIASAAGRETEGYKFGTNPCSEIILRSEQFCNLSTVVVKSDDQPTDLIEKIRLATILGTIQSTFTNFKYFELSGNGNFKNNCEEERLLGVSMTGIFDNPITNGGHGAEELAKLLSVLKKVARDTNKVWANYLGINESTSITCVKPEGTTSCVAGSASGLHPRFAKHYIRRVRLDVKDPITQLMKDAGVPWEPCVMRPDNTIVFSFPIYSDGVTQDQINALGHLNLWLAYQLWFCDHKPSVTVNYTDDDFLAIGAWLWQWWNKVSGVSFLPKEDHCYQQAPFEAITEEVYNKMVEQMPTNVDFNLLSKYEIEDETKNAQTLACTAGGCELT